MSLIVQVSNKNAGAGTATPVAGSNGGKSPGLKKTAQINLQHQQHLHMLNHMPQPPTVAIASIAEQQTQQHIVQHHPPPLAPVLAMGVGDARLRMIQVPHPQLPQSPVHQSALNHRNIRLPQMPLGNPQRIFAAQSSHRQVIVQRPHMSMLPQGPSSALLPTVPTPGLLPANPPGGIIPFPPSNLIPQPQSSSSAKIFPPSAASYHQLLACARPHPMLQQQSFGRLQQRLRQRSDSVDELDIADVPDGQDFQFALSTGAVRNSNVNPTFKSMATSPRGRISTGGRCHVWQCSALQDHNYASRPPPTPPPSPPSPGSFGTTSTFTTQETIINQTQGSSPASHSLLPSSLIVVPPTREQQNSFSIEQAGVGPMVLLEDSSETKDSDEDRVEDDDERSAGEETETAPEADQDEDDSITRCICDYLHDDGYMICCDKCSVWQHVVCMGLDRNNIPDEYLCEVCKPRPIDRKRAKTLQSRRRTEIFHNSSSSDNENSTKVMHRKKPNSKKVLDRRAEIKSRVITKSPEIKSGIARKQKTHKSGKVQKLTTADLKRPIKLKEKKQYRKRKHSEKLEKKRLVEKRTSTVRRKSINNVILDGDDEEEGDQDEEVVNDDSEGAVRTTLEPNMDASQQLRSWIDQYEEAVTNHYSPELRSRLTGSKVSGITGDLRPSVMGAPVKCNVSLKGNGVKILTASSNLLPNTPIIECKGKLMLASQFHGALSSSAKKSCHPYVFFYSLSESLEICLDGKTYGNDARFCRRSNDYNAELRHVLDKGSLHLFIMTLKSVGKNQEILLPSIASREKSTLVSLPSINADLKEIMKPNGVVVGADESVKKEKRAQKITEKSVARKTRKQRSEENECIADYGQKEQSISHVEQGHSEDESIPMNGDSENSNSNHPSSPVKIGSKQSPGKLGLPDNSGLIVGVNTINYDASSALKNKAKSREDRKMEMIMKAIEQMEKAEQRKKEISSADNMSNERSSSSFVVGPTVKRRRSASNKLHSNDSAQDASSADEINVPEPKCGVRKKGRKSSNPATPQRRRSRVLSGGSASAVSENEANLDPTSTPNTCINGPFRFPKTKKSMMSDWLQESVEDDDVSGSYLRGSRSPPGIATHLLRSAPHSPVKSVCSAKKRWLRQAISEDHSELANGGDSPGQDYVTPLKKRRLASYKGDQATEEEDSEHKHTPNSLKKKLLHNLVLEAVLDKAMEDMLGKRGDTEEECPDTPSPGKENEEGELNERLEIKGEDDHQARSRLSDLVVEEKPVMRNSCKVSASTTTSEAVKTPEPSSAFKSFFKSNVSIEELEAEWKANKQKMESIALEVSELKVETDDQASRLNNKTVQEMAEEKKDDKIEFMEKEDKKNEVKVETHFSPLIKAHSNPIPLQNEILDSENSKFDLETPKPTEKRRVSLADYKRRRKQETSTYNTDKEEVKVGEEGPGTPTLDEQLVSLSGVPTLSTLPLFEKLEKLEQAHKLNKKKVETSLTDSSTAEPKREDLTERLKKEFGLTVDDETDVADEKAEENDDGDATPEMDTDVPALPKVVTVGASKFQPIPFHPPQRFTPTQYPSYPPNYPLPPYPKSSKNPISTSQAGPSEISQGTMGPLKDDKNRRDYYTSSSSHSPANRGYYTSERSERKSERSNERDFRRDHRVDSREYHHHRDRDYRDLHRGSPSSGGTRDSRASRSYHSRGSGGNYYGT